MNAYKVKVGKLVDKHVVNENSGYRDVPLSIVEEEQLSCLLSSFFSASFQDRERLIKLLEV